MNNNIGIITEQNDLGLGFDPLNQKDQKTYQQNNQAIKANYNVDKSNDQEPDVKKQK